MKRGLTLLLACACLLCCILVAPASPRAAAVPEGIAGYDPQAAVEYARAHAQARNRNYPDLEYNCTGFVSQCLVAGGLAMDEGLPPQEGVRIQYDDDGAKWYCESLPDDTQRPPAFSVSTSFVRTTDFLRYWTERRGMPLLEYPNSFAGRKTLVGVLRPGDVLVLYDTRGKPAHIGLVTETKADDAFFCSNTQDRLDMSVCTFNDEVYPTLGVLSFY